MKLKATYETDTVFSKASVDKAMGKVEAIKNLPKGIKKGEIAEAIFRDMNLSDGEAERIKLKVEYTEIIKEKPSANCRWQILHHFLCEFNDKLCCTVNTKSRGIDSYIVVIILAPFVAGVEVVV